MSELRQPSRTLTLTAFGLIGAVTLWRLALLAFDAPNLSFDEAQYWAWAQTIQLGYYSKPPMVAWAIAATTALLGEGEGAVKLSSTLAHTGIALLMLPLGRALYNERVGGDKFGAFVGAWAGMAWITMPAVSLSALMITTDPFLLFFWTAALLALVEAPRRGLGPNRWWVLLGLAFGFGLLSKYAMAFFVVCVGLWMVWDKDARRLLKAPGLWLAGGLGLLIYAPNLLWNAANGFVSYAHTKDNANLKGGLFNPDKLAEFVGGQFGVFGPILMTALVLALIAACRRNADPKARLLTAFTLPVLAVMTVESFLSRANANWTAPAFIGGILLAVSFLAARAPRWLKASLALHLLIAGAMYNHESLRVALRLPDSAKYDPEKRLKGWDVVGKRVSTQLAAHPGARLLADERKVLATLTYYVHPHPFTAVKWNPGGVVRDHFDQTTRLNVGEAELIYVTELPDLPDDVRRRFDGTQMLESIRIPIHPDYARAVTIWRLTGFRGY